MQLSFLGKPYIASTSTVEVVETQETATFLGRAYRVKQYNTAQAQQPARELSFMGRRYTH